MALNFNGTTDYLRTTTAPVTAAPFTLACWFNADDAATGYNLMELNDASDLTQIIRLRIAGNVAGDPVRVITGSSGSNEGADTSTSYSAATWHHACFTSTGAANRTAYLDGGGAVTNSNSVTPSGIDVLNIGRKEAGGGEMNGRIAHAAVWGIALSAGEVAQLAGKLSPLVVRPESLVSYWPITGSGTTQIDVVGGNHLTIAGTPNKTGSVYITEPWMLNWSEDAPAAGGANPLASKLALLGVGI